MIDVIQLRHLRRLAAPTDAEAKLGLKHPRLALEFVGFPETLPPEGAALPGGLGLQQTARMIRAHYLPDGPGDWLVYSVFGNRGTYSIVRRAVPPQRVPDPQRPDREHWRWSPAPPVAAVADTSGDGSFYAGVVPLAPEGLVLLAFGEFGHGRQLWHATRAGVVLDDLDRWYAAAQPVQGLTPPEVAR